MFFYIFLYRGRIFCLWLKYVFSKKKFSRKNKYITSQGAFLKNIISFKSSFLFLPTGGMVLGKQPQIPESLTRILINAS